MQKINLKIVLDIGGIKQEKDISVPVTKLEDGTYKEESIYAFSSDNTLLINIKPE